MVRLLSLQFGHGPGIREAVFPAIQPVDRHPAGVHGLFRRLSRKTHPGTTLLDLGGLQVKLEELLGMQVDLLTPGDLPRPARDRVLSEAVPI
jgi:hypothetical protein